MLIPSKLLLLIKSYLCQSYQSLLALMKALLTSTNLFLICAKLITLTANCDNKFVVTINLCE